MIPSEAALAKTPRWCNIILMTENSYNPVLVEVTRGDGVESRHTGAATIVTAAGDVIASWGDVAAPVLPRSAIKSMQALALVETGAADHFDVSDEELAIACASHSSEPEHLKCVNEWLGRLGLEADDLECGATGSIEETVHADLIRQGASLTRVHNNCSGKHAGFLTTALHMGEPTKGYIGADHPVQRRLIDILQEMGEVDLDGARRGCDGCGIPVIAMPLAAMALGFAKMAAPAELPPSRIGAIERIAAALAANPLMVAGRRRFDTVVIEATGDSADGPALVKTGAEGVHGAFLPGLGLGVALKIDDGARRAAEVVMAAILVRLGVIDAALEDTLADLITPPIVNASGEKVGDIRASAAFDVLI